MWLYVLSQGYVKSAMCHTAECMNLITLTSPVYVTWPTAVMAFLSKTHA